MLDYLEAGKIINTHGVRGEIKIDSWCDTPQVLAGLQTLYLKDKNGVYTPLSITRAYVHKHFVIAHPHGFTTFEQAVTLREKTVYAARADLPIAPGAHFIADLIGLPVIDIHTACVYGKLANVINRGASDLYEVETKAGIVYVPVVDEFVKKIDETGIYLAPIAGMFSPAEDVDHAL